MMSRFVFFFLIVAPYQVWARVPSSQSICGLIVDAEYQNRCLDCFSEAGPLQQNPEEYRVCVATYLPPLLAECAVPHPTKKMARIQDLAPDIHHNHTNANLLPNCLKRRRRELSRYLKKENRFTEEAGHIVKTVVTSRFIRNGGPNMLSIASMFYILQDPAVKELVEFGAASCFESTRMQKRVFKFGDLHNKDSSSEESYGDFDFIEEDNDDDERDLDSLFSEEEEEEGEEDEGVGENPWKPFLREGASTTGNVLPYGGTNALSEDMEVGKCIIDALIKNNMVLHLITIISKDEFFYPIPSMWVEPILRYYKKFRETLESQEDGRRYARKL